MWCQKACCQSFFKLNPITGFFMIIRSVVCCLVNLKVPYGLLITTRFLWVHFKKFLSENGLVTQHHVATGWVVADV
jgi:hypothetical protein